METVLNFLKKHRFDIIVTCSVFAFIYDLYIDRHVFSFTIIALYALGYAADDERSRNNVAERRALGLRGQTSENLSNSEFSKNWEETRKKGVINYSVVYGGIFFGFILCGIFSILALVIIKDMLKYIEKGPSNMFNFIGYTYIAGVIGATILYRLLWIYKEQKFIRLNAPPN